MHARYAELFSEHVAFSVNKTSVQDVVDMQAVLAYWDRVVQHQDELGGYDLLRTYPYRVNIDVQVSVGASRRCTCVQPVASQPAGVVTLTLARAGPCPLSTGYRCRLLARWVPDARASGHRR